MNRPLIAVGIVASLAGCSHGRSGSSAGDTLRVHVAGGAVTEAKVTDSAVVGPDVQVNVSSSGLRGKAFNRPVEVTWKADEVTGMIGRTPVQLSVRREGDQLYAHGLFEGRLSDLRVSPTGIEGPIGSCSYSLKGSQTEYQGFRSCSQAPQSPTTVEIPPGLWEKPDAEKIALLALMLSH